MVKSTFLSFLSVAWIAALALSVSGAFAEPRMVRRGRISVQHGLSKRLNSSAQDVERAGDRMEARADSKLRFNYGTDKVRGVGIGGWLVIENFIAPSVYERTGDDRVIDEWSFGKYVPHDKAVKILRDHFDNFIKESDFEEIASLGLNHVRIPFPYWGIKTYDDDPYIKLNQYDKLKEAAHWADKYGLKVIIELHTVPGLANPYDHGGHTGHMDWLKYDVNKDRWLEILDELASEFSQSKYPAVTAISIVNEPNGDVNEILGQYKRGYNRVRNSESDAELVVIIGDVFLNVAENDYWHSRMQPPKYQGVMTDTHVYRIFDQNSISMSQQDRYKYYCSLKGGLAANNHLWALIGEWSPVFTDCAPGLNGRFKGARYDGSFPDSTYHGSCDGKSGNAKNFSDHYKRLLRKNWDFQTDAYEAGAGWIMWTWRTENHNADDWSYRQGVRHGWIPRDPTQRKSTC